MLNGNKMVSKEKVTINDFFPVQRKKSGSIELAHKMTTKFTIITKKEKIEGMGGDYIILKNDKIRHCPKETFEKNYIEEY